MNITEKKVYMMMLAMVAMLLVAATMTGCKKDCFDQALYDEYKDKACTADCPGVKGCDGNTYCNECEANKRGIRVEE